MYVFIAYILSTMEICGVKRIFKGEIQVTKYSQSSSLKIT